MDHGKKVADFLGGLDFPVTKKEVLEYARDNNAPPDIMETLTRLPERRYFSITSVWDVIESEEE
jgi:hypothetical protein